LTARRLVFGDDGSVTSERVWAWIAAHRWPGWTISVVTALDPADWALLPPDRVPLVRWEPPHPRRLPASDTVVEHLLGEGDPRAVLDSCGDAALTVIGPRGTGVLRQLHIGSTAEWLLQSPCPPLVLVRNSRPVQTVLLCADGSAHALRAAASLAELPWIARTHVVVLAVRDGRTDADHVAAEAAAVLRAAGTEPEVTTPDGERGFARARSDVRSVIFRTIAERDVDLVALGTSGFGTVRRAVLGSTASAVAHHAPCSVLVAAQRGGHS